MELKRGGHARVQTEIVPFPSQVKLKMWSFHRLQNSPYFCVFKYARAVKQKVWNEAENRERDYTLRACEARAVRAHETLTPRVTDFFTDFEEKTDCFAV